MFTNHLAQLVAVACSALVLVGAARGEENPWSTDFAAAKAQAKVEKKLLLVDFTGSDWCPPCMRLKAEVFDTDVFKTAAQKQFVLVELDFPRDNVLPADLKKQNAELAQRYGITGYPTVLLLDVEGQILSRSGYRPGGGEAYLAHLKDLVSTYEQVAKLQSKLESTAGLERAKLLDEIVVGCEKLDVKNVEIERYGREIVALDLENKAGLRLKYAYRALMADAAKLLKERKPAEARAAYDQAIELSGITPEQKQNALFDQGGACFALKDFAGVVKCLEQAIAAAPKSARVASIQATLKRFARLAAAQASIAKLEPELEKATGLDRARLLDRLIAAHKVLGPAVPDSQLATRVEKWSREIIELDPENTAGLNAKYEKPTRPIQSTPEQVVPNAPQPKKSPTPEQQARLKRAYELNIEVVRLFESNQFHAALPLAEDNLKTIRDIFGEQHPLTATSLMNVAAQIEGMGDYSRAEPLYIKVQEIMKQTRGEKHHDYAQSLSNLARLYKSMGDYVRAKPLSVQVLEILQQTLGEKHPDYATNLNILAGIYHSMGDYARAEPLYVQALEIEKQTLGEKHSLYLRSLNNLALLYGEMGDYARAEPLYVQALINKQTLGENHPSYAMLLNNLALIYLQIRDNARAEPLLIQALKIRKQTLGEKHPDYAMSLNNLAGMYYSMGDYARAEPLYVQGLEIEKQALGETHPSYASTLEILAGLHATIGDYARAEPMFRQALTIARRSLESTARVQSERQQLAMSLSLRHQLDAYVSLGVNSNQYTRNIFAELLSWKGSTLSRQRGMRLAADDPAVAESFMKLQRVAGRLASLSRAVPEQESQRALWRTQLSELTHEKEKLEAELSAKSAAFRQATQVLTLAGLLSALPKDAVLVDYLEFRRSTASRAKGKTIRERQLVAFVVRHAENPEDQLRMIALGPSAPVNKAIDDWRSTFGMEPAGEAAGKQLRAALWEPLLTSFGDAKTIVVSTDGRLGRLPLAALPGKKPGTYLLEDHRLAMLPVPQLLPALMSGEGSREPARELLLLGDVNYDAVPGTMPTAVPASQLVAAARSPGGRAPTSENEQFSHLPGTKDEVTAIGRLFRESRKLGDERFAFLTKTDATEARFRELAPQCRYLHLATHGFFAPAKYRSALAPDEKAQAQVSFTERAAPVVGFSPSLLSGLAFAGANRGPSGDGDDGILTAEEIAFLPLDGVRLVTLSACETGLGQTAGGEGLLGLQRAFQVSGARTTIASYWKVDDQVTRFLMERFYKNLAASTPEKPVGMLDALREAQLWVLRHPQEVADAATRGPGVAKPLPNGGKPTAATNTSVTRSPIRHWAAFALSGDWR